MYTATQLFEYEIELKKNVKRLHHLSLDFLMNLSNTKKFKTSH